MPLQVDADARARSRPRPDANATTDDSIPPQVIIRCQRQSHHPLRRRATIENAPPAPSSAAVPAGPVPAPARPFVEVSARRLGSSRWELQWPLPKISGVTYRIEERLLALDAKTELQISWRTLSADKISTANNRVSRAGGHESARASHSAGHRLNPDGSVLWESQLISLPPGPRASHGRAYLLILFGGCWSSCSSSAGARTVSLPNDKMSSRACAWSSTSLSQRTRQRDVDRDERVARPGNG